MPKRLVYPRGFDTVTPNGNVRADLCAVDGDPEVTLHYNQYMTKHGEYKSWEFVSAVLGAAKRLIGRDFARWVEQQNANVFLNGNAIRFIADTIKVITEGRREVTHLNWLPMLTNLPQADLIQNRRFALSKAHMDAARKVNLDYLQQWLSKPNGFEDLLITLYALYGEVDTKAAFISAGAQELQSTKNYKADMLLKAFR